jgi:hypothetical protein
MNPVADPPPTIDQAVESYLASRADTPHQLKQILTNEPENLLAGCFMGYLFRLAGDRRNAQRAAAIHRELEARVGGGAGTPRERAHVHALGMWLADALHALMAHFETLLDAQPDDLLALRMLHYLYFYDGDVIRMRDSVGVRLADFADHPMAGYVQGMYAFGLEECGDYARAEQFGRSAVALNGADVWATHAVAHVMEMQGRPADGIAWLDDRKAHWQGTNNFRFHLHWHEALFHLARGARDAVLDVYDTEVGPAIADDFYLDVCNAASLLLRLEAAGVDVGDRWTPLADIAESHLDDAELVFASLHYLMPLLRTRRPGAQRVLDGLATWATRDSTQGRIVRDVALGVAHFLAAIEAGEVDAAQRCYLGFHDDLHRIGGSRAQRQLFEILYSRVA